MVVLLPSTQGCVALAAALSSKYRSYANPYNNTVENLNSFLDQNGILLSMCKHPSRWPSANETIGFSLRLMEKVMAASWVQESQTSGFRVFRIPDDFGVGMVLDPLRVEEIHCFYPIDASSDNRDGKGCGPISNDPQYGSIGKTRAHHWMIKNYLEMLKATNFPDTPWADISCRDFLQVPVTTENVIVTNYDLNTSSSSSPIQKYEKYEVFLKRFFDSFMGHSVCNLEGNVEPQFGEHDWFITMSSSGSFLPSEWNEMLNTMRGIILEHPHVKIWNDMVLSKPRNSRSALNHMIQAVFYVIDPNANPKTNQKFAELARWEADTREKPLLVVDLQSVLEGGDLFQCEGDAAAAAVAPSLNNTRSGGIRGSETDGHRRPGKSASYSET